MLTTAFLILAETLIRTVTLTPDQPAALMAVPSGYTCAAVEGGVVGAAETMAGIEIIRIEGTNAITVTFSGEPVARPAGSRLLRARIQEKVVNPEDIASSVTASVRRAAFAAGNAVPDYLIIAPPDYVTLWESYAEKRREAHPELTVSVVNAADIYAEYPFGGTDYRNPAESIHKYLRTDAKGADYVLLGGAWIDAQKLSDEGAWQPNGTNVYDAAGGLFSLSNSIPGIITGARASNSYTNPPSDMVYACLDLTNGQKYPWCRGDSAVYYDAIGANTNGWHVADVCDQGVDVIVSRISLKPMQVGDRVYSSQELLEAYEAKLARGESADFAGSGRFGLGWSEVSSSPKLNGNLPDEHEFWDDAPNLYDPDRLAEKYNDMEITQRKFLRDVIATNYAVRAVDVLGSYIAPRGFASEAEGAAHFYASDHDYSSMDSHGSSQGAGWMTRKLYKTATGLTLLNDLSLPCETAWLDAVEHCIAEVSVLAPNGGTLATIANTREGWASDIMAYWFYHQQAIDFLQNGRDAGNVWLTAHLEYLNVGGHDYNNHAGFTLVEHILFGDPLVAIHPREKAITFSAGENVIPADTNAYLTATCAGDLSLAATDATARLKILQSLSLSGTSLTIGEGLEGGIASVTFTGDRGTITINSTGRFYLGAVTNCSAIIVKGTGTVIDVDALQKSGFLSLTFDTDSSATNILRSTKECCFDAASLSVKGGTLLMETASGLTGLSSTKLYEGTLILGNNPLQGAMEINSDTMTAYISGTGAIVYPYGSRSLRTFYLGSSSEIELRESLPFAGRDFPDASYSLALDSDVTTPSSTTKGSKLTLSSDLPGDSDFTSETVSNLTITALRVSGSAHPDHTGALIRGDRAFSVLCVAKAADVSNGTFWSIGEQVYYGTALGLMRSGDTVKLVRYGTYSTVQEILSAKVSDVTTAYHAYLLVYDPDDADGYFRLYIDHELAATCTTKYDFDCWTSLIGVYAATWGYQLGGIHGGGSALNTGAGFMIDEFSVWTATALTASQSDCLAELYPACGVYTPPEPEPEPTPTTDLPEPYIWYEFNGNRTASSAAVIDFGGGQNYTTGATNGANTALYTTSGCRIWGNSGASFGTSGWSLRVLARLDEAYPSGFATGDGICVATFGKKGAQGFGLVKCGTAADPKVGVKRWGDSDKTLYLATSVPDCATAYHDYVLTATNGILKLYIDGVCTNKVVVALPDSGDTCQLGSMYSGLEGTFWGGTVAIDDFRIYHQALTETQVAALAGLPVPETPDYTNGYITTDGVATGWKNLTLAELARYGFEGTMDGGWVSEGTATGYCISNDTANAQLLVQMQKEDGNFIKVICLAFYLDGSEVYAKAKWCRDVYKKDYSLGVDCTNLSNAEGNPGVATADTADGYGIKALTLTVPPVYETDAGDEIAVDVNWLAKKGYTTDQVGATAQNGHYTVAECYVLGLDPTDAADDFTVTITFEGGVPKISSSVEGKVLSGWTIETQGKTALTDTWGAADTAKHHFFRVRVVK